MSFRKFQAKAILGLLFFRHLFIRALLFWRRTRGLPAFYKHFSADHIIAVSSEERTEFPAYGRCYNCSQCTFSCQAIIDGKAPGGFEPKFIMLGAGRSSHESEYFLEEWVPCIECDGCRVFCPNEVPIHKMAKRIQERRKSIAFRS